MACVTYARAASTRVSYRPSGSSPMSRNISARWRARTPASAAVARRIRYTASDVSRRAPAHAAAESRRRRTPARPRTAPGRGAAKRSAEVGRGAGRGRGESSGGAGSFKKKNSRYVLNCITVVEYANHLEVDRLVNHVNTSILLQLRYSRVRCPTEHLNRVVTFVQYRLTRS